MVAPQFIEVSGVVINTSQISFIDFRREGTATVCVGANTVGVEGEEAAGLRRFFMPAPTPAVENPPTPAPGPQLVPTPEPSAPPAPAE